MDILYVLLVSLALSMDCFAISVCISSISKIKLRDYLIIPLHFSIFHVAMVFIGYYMGIFFKKIIQGVDHWAAFVLLTGIGIKIILDSLKSKGKLSKPTSELRLLLLSLATSIDALVIGITFAFSQIDIHSSSLILGAVVLAVTFTGIILGEKLHKMNLRYTGIVGGAVLIIIGIKTAITHLIG